MIRNPQIFCALDTADLDQAVSWARTIGPVTGGLKLGLEFFNAFGPQGLQKVQQACPDAALFIDLKFHDIPNTVAGAVRAVTQHIQPAYLNVHAAGGAEMMRAAKEACPEGTKLLAVTILTSLSEEAIADVGYQSGLSDRVQQMAKLAEEYGLDGVVCSAHEIKMLRECCSKNFALMVPGIRPASAAQDDQKRTMTPEEALGAGATHLVIGRPITKAADPAAAAQSILDQVQQIA